MSGSIPASTPPVRARRWRVPPPLTRSGELLEGVEVLSEVTGETAVLLWKALRNVTLWASASTHDRQELFAPGARQRRMAEIVTAPLDVSLRVPLENLTAILEEPQNVRREGVALACRQIAQWACTRGAHATELAFIQGAALSCPADADLAFQVGRLTRSRGELARAESWYRRAIMLGRQTGSWSAYARGFHNLGIMARQRGNFPLAKRHGLKAERAAGRHGLTEIRAMALHELFAVSVECDDASTAQRYATEAYRAYGASHPYVRYLAHDLCCLWMREGQFQRALPVLDTLVPLFAEDERLLIASNRVRACGGIADRVSFQEAWRDAVALLERFQTHGVVGEAMLSLARGATGVGEWERAETMANQALAFASSNSNGELIFAAESVLAFARNRRAVESNANRNAHEPVEQQADRLASEMITSFRAMATV